MKTNLEKLTRIPFRFALAVLGLLNNLVTILTLGTYTKFLYKTQTNLSFKYMQWIIKKN